MVAFAVQGCKAHTSKRITAHTPEIVVMTSAPLIIDKDALWRPALRTSWQWQLSGEVERLLNVEVYDIDLFDNDSRLVDALHAQDRWVICYINVGAWEDWRPDKDQFPTTLIGRKYQGWPGE